MHRFRLRPVESGGAFFTECPAHVLLGISPWNGRYKTAYIEELVGWACSRFPRVDVMIPGYEAAHTLVAAGRPPASAVKRAKRSVNQLRNPAERALRHAGIDDPAGHVHAWTRLLANAPYATRLAEAQRAYRQDPAVRAACREAARATLVHAGCANPSDAALDTAVSYPLAELPLTLHSPAIFGVPSSLFLYHRDMELLRPFLTGTAQALRPGAGQGYAIVEPIGAER
ncbi:MULTISPECIES: tRNA-dependent cyclodipeptide synthase [unclassified Streptomyces]|uniref:tRNA-dependent cyclodipeptide synthase n=1 Tax=unclassified Streptomyces TaxID=2593676 RepID=UPI000DBA1851|nr:MULTISPECIES: tRNA-dependent cyclodipeptide synthase [Streptomyces]MYU08119.1 tRNA-dependent cyclodipeptide synthase [Streptomyces sp. SID8366]MYU65573.1 tRNA-dependent cyclodipeptide synthase [Streptomyces sp. SID69]RAJ59316.1 cyclo(L-tyrosyl-L-tyrosyl) synthase [Streptomyces sp. PsTaAH-130]TXJ76306.1 tRNA-dependent cyclodipeptide synthase [Streptomyces lavendulae]